jgi:hypothetical protein
MATVPCVCTSSLCGHVAGERCVQPVRVKLKLSVAIGDSGLVRSTRRESAIDVGRR